MKTDSEKEISPIAFATWNNDITTINNLLNDSLQDDKNHALHCASIKGFNNIIKLLLDNGATVDLSKEYNPLIAVARKNNIEGAKLLLSSTYNNDKKDKALIIAAEKGHIEMVEFLYQNGADINANNGAALMKASEKNHINIIKFLIEAGVDVKNQDSEALFRACYYGHYQAASILLNHGANPRGHNNDNKLIYLADKNNYKAIVTLLKEYGASLEQVIHKPLDLQGYNSILKEMKDCLPQTQEEKEELTKKIQTNELMLNILPQQFKKPKM